MLEYIDLKYKPSDDELIAEYYIEPNKISIEEACEHIAGESSIGTWTDIATMNEKVAKRLKPHVFSINRMKNIVKISYPAELFEPSNMPQILSSIAGNIYGMKAINNLRLLDIQFPKLFVNQYKGPEFGIEGIRKLMRVKERPFCGTIIKPKVGLDSKNHARVAYEAWTGGLDFVKDDENLTDQPFNRFESRIVETLEARDKAESETGEKKMYFANVTAETEEMIQRAEFVKSNGGEYIMVDILTAGFSALQTLRKQNLKLVLHGHRAMHAALTRNPRHGISMLSIAKIARLIGMDQLHIGTAVGKMEGSAAEVVEIENEIEENLIMPKIHPDKAAHALEQEWHHIKPMLAVASGGLHPGHTKKLIEILGKNVVMQYGGGCHGHPDGTYGGAKAIRQSIDAAINKVPLNKWSRMYPELEKAIDKWGYLE
jgi:ribulose-bisphosphate carboxylase large chain